MHTLQGYRHIISEIWVYKMCCKGMIRGYDKFYMCGEDVNRDFTEEVLKDE